MSGGMFSIDRHVMTPAISLLGQMSAQLARHSTERYDFPAGSRGGHVIPFAELGYEIPFWKANKWKARPEPRAALISGNGTPFWRSRYFTEMN
jgi:hypothetical protein